jgi:hypothetical protein
MSQSDLLALLAVAHPGASQSDLLSMLDAIPTKASQKLAKRVIGARPRSPASVERRRSLASGGWMPGNLAARFTVGEVAALAVIAQEVVRHGACRLFIEQIAALAGVTRSTVKRALKEAHGLGLIRIEERRLTGWRNDANVVTITDPAWLTWLRMRQRGEGSRKEPARNTKIQTRGFRNEEAAQAPGQTPESGARQTLATPHSAQGSGLPPRSSMAGNPPAAGMPRLQWWGMHRNARLRGS